MELLLPALLLVVGYSFGSLRVLRQYERGVSFFLGKYWGTKGPGLTFVPLGFAQMKRMTLRTCSGPRKVLSQPARYSRPMPRT